MTYSTRKLLLAAAVASLALVAVAVATSAGRNALWSAYTRIRGRATVDERLAALGDGVRTDVRGWCTEADLKYPPSEVAIVVFKSERVMHIYARSGADWRHLAQVPILGASGGPGPKLAAGDDQVPEGEYSVESLNPNSRYHLALKLGYPNRFDLDRARSDGRTRLGGDIMIHGGSLSIGCIAIGDSAIERVFLLGAEVGVDAMRVLIAPCDLRRNEAPEVEGAPPWLLDLYAGLHRELIQFPRAD